MCVYVYGRACMRACLSVLLSPWSVQANTDYEREKIVRNKKRKKKKHLKNTINRLFSI